MEWDDYLRQQAATYRQLAEKAEDAVVKTELLDLADVCEEVANREWSRTTIQRLLNHMGYDGQKVQMR